MQRPIPAICLAVMAAGLAPTAEANTFELATASIGSNFPTCIGPAASTNDGSEATLSCGGSRSVTGYPLPATMFTQAFAAAAPNVTGLRVIVDIQNAINTGANAPLNDPNNFDSGVGFGLESETQDTVSFSAGASAVFTWTFHEHMVQNSGEDNGRGTFSETAAFGFTPVLSESDVFWTCDLNCKLAGTAMPGIGHVFDMTFTKTVRVPFTPGQPFNVFDRMTLNGFIDIQAQANPFQENEHVDLDLLDPVTVSAQVFDSQGNQLTDVTGTSALGVDYLGQATPGVPEPGSLPLAALGMVAVVVSMARRRGIYSLRCPQLRCRQSGASSK